MKKKIRILTVIISLLSISQHIKAQEKFNKTFVVKENGSHIDTQPYLHAVEKSDFNCYHLSKSRRVLTFDTGVTVELFSISEMLMNNIKINRTCAVDETQLNNKAPVYHLDQSGLIVELHEEGSSYQKH